MSAQPPGKVSGETPADEAAQSYPQPIKVHSVDELLEGRRRFYGPAYTREHAEREHAEFKAAAEHAEKVALMVDRLVAEAGEHWRPTDQGRNPSIAELKAAPFKDAHWIAVRRWSWIAVGVDWWACQVPPWASPRIHGNRHRAIAERLKYCLQHNTNLPRLTPVGNVTTFSPGNNPTELPPISIVSGPHIPRGIVKLYQQARCAEALAFVWSFRGGPDMESIRRLIAAPSLERVAEAYAIATSNAFERSRVVEAMMENVSPEPAKMTTRKIDMKELRQAHSALLRPNGLPLKCFAILWAEDEDSHSVLKVARSNSRGMRERAEGALLKLEAAGLAKRVVGQGRGEHDRWTLGDAARQQRGALTGHRQGTTEGTQ